MKLISLATSATAGNNNIAIGVQVIGNLMQFPGGPLSAPMSVLTNGKNALTASGKRKGWPLKHCRRSHFYHTAIRRMHFSVKCTLMNNKVNPILSTYEEEQFAKIRAILAELYNNRFEEYYKMSCEEKKVEYCPRNKTNKFILN